jgi:hypothetical protein
MVLVATLIPGRNGLQNLKLDSLQSAVQEVIDQDGIGRPAALRLTIHARGTEPDAWRILSDAENLAAAWFGGKPDSNYSIGGSGSPIVTALKWSSGQSAILSVSVGASGPVGGNAMLMGTRGTIYHEIDNSESWSE